jgi:hypothetical protein
MAYYTIKAKYQKEVEYTTVAGSEEEALNNVRGDILRDGNTPIASASWHVKVSRKKPDKK